jgi:hypothetical protein
MCTIKGDDFIPVSRRLLLLVHQWCLSSPQSHMATIPPWFLGSLSFSGWQENLLPLWTHEPAVYGKRQNLTMFQRAQRLDISTHDEDCMTFLYDLMTFSLHPLGSASWCTRYGPAHKWTYSNQPIFLFLDQNGCRFDWRPSGVGVPRYSARSVWAPSD